MGDGGAQASLLHQGVVARIRAAQGVACDAHGFGAADAFAGKGACGRADQREVVCAEFAHGARAAQGRHGGGGVGLRSCRQAGDGEVGFADVSRAAQGAGAVVVARIRAAQGVAADGDGFSGALVFIGKGSRSGGAAHGDDVIGQSADYSGAAQRGDGGGVIDP